LGQPGGRNPRPPTPRAEFASSIESKLRATSAVRSLWERTRDLAWAERKTPVLALFAERKHGVLIVRPPERPRRVRGEPDPGRPRPVRGEARPGKP
jgi:hypothetical protein